MSRKATHSLQNKSYWKLKATTVEYILKIHNGSHDMKDSTKKNLYLMVTVLGNHLPFTANIHKQLRFKVNFCIFRPQQLFIWLVYIVWDIDNCRYLHYVHWLNKLQKEMDKIKMEMNQFTWKFLDIPVTAISKFKLKFLSKSTIFFQILQTKMMTFGIITNTTCCFWFKQHNVFHTFQNHEFWSFLQMTHKWKLLIFS